MSAKREFFDKAVAELNLDVRDPFTLLFANACALLDQRDELKREVAALREATIEECAKVCDQLFAEEKNTGDVDWDDNAWTRICARSIRALKGKP